MFRVKKNVYIDVNLTPKTIRKMVEKRMKLNENECRKLSKTEVAAASNESLHYWEALVPEHRLDMHLIKLRLIQKRGIRFD